MALRDWIPLLLTAVIAASPALAEDEATIALFDGRGVWDDSATATKSMLHWMGYSPYLIDAGLIERGDLAHYDLLFIPGSDMFKIAEDISDAGKENIREFIRNGGGYVGVCGGAYFAGKRIVWGGKEMTDDPLLEIFDGTCVGVIDQIAQYPKYDMCTVEISDKEHPITTGIGETIRLLYYWGPLLLPDAGSDVAVLGRYQVNDRAAMVAFEYGLGRVFLIGPIAEIEEDDERDGTDFGDAFDDEGSDWPLMRNAVLWCLGN
jgi:glutamine amidotransferase-like uncharacterized protein